jgi:hypothetical protein
MTPPAVLVIDTVTKLGPEAEGAVLVCGSHGGVYAGHEAAIAGVRAVILHDAAVGLDAAGIGALAYLATLGIAAATVGHRSAVIGNGRSMADHGVISFVNDVAARLGCAPGQSAMDCARAMRAAERPAIAIPDHAEARFIIRERAGEPAIRGCDSVSLVRAEDEGAIVVTASHGELLAGSPSWGRRPDVLAAVFNDAGSTTVTRLPDLDTREIAGATVSAASARIGDARSTWQTGVISHINERAKSLGATPGLTTRAFADLLIAATRQRQ